MNIFIFIWLYILGKKCIYNKNIVSEEAVLFENQLYIKGNLTGSNKAKYFVVDLSSPFSFTTSMLTLDRSDKDFKSLQNTTIEFCRDNFTCEIIKNRISIGGTELSDFTYYDIHDVIFQRTYDTLSFSFKHIDRRHSITHLLKEKKLISNLIFSFKFYETWNDKSKGVVFFGGVPKKEVKAYKYKEEVKLIKRDNQSNNWDVRLTGMKFYTKKASYYYSLSNYIHTYFQTNAKRIYVPEDFLDYLARNFLSELIKERKCATLEGVELKSIMCDCKEENLRRVPNITFEFDHNSLFIFTWRELFTFVKETFVRDNYCYFAFEGKKKVRSEWIIGSPFLRYFTSVFDYDNNQITLYGNITIISGKKEAFNVNEDATRLILMIVNIILLVVITISLCFVKEFKIL